MSGKGRALAPDRRTGRLFPSLRRLLAGLENLLGRGVNFLEKPRREPYGLVAVFVDPWGGKWDLLQPAGGAADTP